MLDLENLPAGIDRANAEEILKIIEKVEKDFKRFEKENTEDPEETIAINDEINRLLKEYPLSRVLSDGSLAMYDSEQKIRIRHTRKNLAPKSYSMIVNSKCISAQPLNFEVVEGYEYPKPVYYQTIVKKGVLERLKPVTYKWELDLGLSYRDTVNLIKMLNRKNPDKEFFLENF
jgi:hypothetical protein